MQIPHRRLALVTAVTALLVACSSTPQQMSPTAPSAAAPAGLAQQGDAVSTPTGESAGPGVTSEGPSAPGEKAPAGADGIVSDPAVVRGWAAGQPGWTTAADMVDALEVEGTGPITAVSGACPNVVLTIYGIPVTVNGGTTYGSTTTCAQLTEGTVVRVRGLVTIVGGVTSVVAVRISVEDDRVVEGEGRVLAVSGSCPTLTISVDGITVVTDAQTVFLPPSGCAEIRVGTKVRVRGVPVAGGANFRALSVAVTGQRHMVEGEGRITAVAGGCPDVTVSIGEVRVLVNSATVYRGGTCAGLQPGVKIEARGYRDDGGPIVATIVEFRARHVEGEGSVTSLSGSCPNLQLTVQGIRVVTNASTRFEDGRCSSIAVGTRIEIKGDMMTADGSVIAEEVEIEGQSSGTVLEGEGTVAAASGSCPARTIVVGGYSATAGAGTVFRNGSCADLVTGRRVRARGEVRSGAVVVLEVEFR